MNNRCRTWFVLIGSLNHPAVSWAIPISQTNRQLFLVFVSFFQESSVMIVGLVLAFIFSHVVLLLLYPLS